MQTARITVKQSGRGGDLSDDWLKAQATDYRCGRQRDMDGDGLGRGTFRAGIEPFDSGKCADFRDHSAPELEAEGQQREGDSDYDDGYANEDKYDEYADVQHITCQSGGAERHHEYP
jgi:hypothetical protein